MKRWIQQNIIWRGTIRRIKHYGSGGCMDHFPPSYSGEETVQIMKEKVLSGKASQHLSHAKAGMK
jgi:hypothetical protein